MYHPCNQRRILLVVAICMWPDLKPSKSDEPAPADKLTAVSMRGKAPGDVRDDNGLKMKLVWCSPGLLTMEQVERIAEPATKSDEDDDESPNANLPGKVQFVETITPVKVLISRGYWLGKHEVTQAEWKQVMACAPWKGKHNAKEGKDFPATYIKWLDAMEFCRTLSELERKAGRMPDGWEYALPTEAQWERACRARTETAFSFGDDVVMLTDCAWFSDNCRELGEEYAHRVGQKKPNPWGLRDMHGNAWEWCRDMYERKLPGGRDPEVANRSSYRVLRGGGWVNRATHCRSAFRGQSTPDARSPTYGFRVALTSVQPADKPEAGARVNTSGRN
jgi:formylglycine-generating enzyme required for sulfatase activity